MNVRFVFRITNLYVFIVSVRTDSQTGDRTALQVTNARIGGRLPPEHTGLSFISVPFAEVTQQ